MPVTLEVEVRRFRCREPGCRGRTFGESLEPFASRRSRYSERSRAALQRIGCALGGEAGTRLAFILGLRAGPDTILRALRRLPLPAVGEPAVVGIDDWAVARGHQYGTLFVDLEQRRPLDLILGREMDEVRDWLAQHPGIRVVARDRAGAYAQAARQALPCGIQVADRWHLLSNLGEMAERVLLRCTQALRVAATAVNARWHEQSTGSELVTSSSAQTAPPSERASARRSAQRRAARLARFEEVRDRHRQGQSARAIARELGLNVKTVRKFIRADSFPERTQRVGRESVLDPWRTYLESRWAEGCRNAAQLWREIRAQGFRGGHSQVRQMFSARRQQEEPSSSGRSSPQSPQRGTPSARRIRFRLFGRPPRSQRDPDEGRWWKEYLDELCRTEPAVEKVRTIGRRFMEMVRWRDAPALPEWLEQARSSSVPELQRFASGIEADREAVALLRK